jgi:hypothetical protein
MRMSNLPENISEDTVLRLRAKMEDLSYRRFDEMGSSHIAFRIPGEKIDLLNSLEYLSEFLVDEELNGLDKIVIISDREIEVANASIMEKKVEVKKGDDQQLYSELKGKLNATSPPLIFTMENDILELYRVALRTAGTVKDGSSTITPEILRMDIPKEGEIFYVVYDDGYRKMGRPTFEKKMDEERSRSQTQLQVLKDNRTDDVSKTVSGSDLGQKQPVTRTEVIRGTYVKSVGEKALVREISKVFNSMGYREDSRFSRPDIDQVLFMGMRGPTLLLKVSLDGEDISPFLRVLEHRKDVIGILICDVWTPALEARSRSGGFFYLTGERARHIRAIVSEVIKGGGN